MVTRLSEREANLWHASARFPDDPIPQLKRDAASALAALLAGWNANDIGAIIGADQPRVSDIKRGKLERFSLEQLIRFLHRLDQHVTLQIEPVLRRFGHGRPSPDPFEPK